MRKHRVSSQDRRRVDLTPAQPSPALGDPGPPRHGLLPSPAGGSAHGSHVTPSPSLTCPQNCSHTQLSQEHPFLNVHILTHTSPSTHTQAFTRPPRHPAPAPAHALAPTVSHTQPHTTHSSHTPTSSRNTAMHAPRTSRPLRARARSSPPANPLRPLCLGASPRRPAPRGLPRPAPVAPPPGGQGAGKGAGRATRAVQVPGRERAAAAAAAAPWAGPGASSGRCCCCGRPRRG